MFRDGGENIRRHIPNEQDESRLQGHVTSVQLCHWLVTTMQRPQRPASPDDLRQVVLVVVMVLVI